MRKQWFEEEMRIIKEIILPDEDRWLEENDFSKEEDEEKAPVICIFTRQRIN